MFNWKKHALLSTFSMVKTDSNLIPLLRIEPNCGSLVLTDIEKGISENLTEVQESFTPLILTKADPRNNGQLLILNFNPIKEVEKENLF